VPDLLVKFGPFLTLMEIKSSGGKLTKDQISFFKKWGNSQVAVVRSRSDANKVLKQLMPIRIYKCEQCGIFENKESIKSDPLTKCLVCGTIVQQVYSVPQIMYKGNGWASKDDTKPEQAT
jgi:putative FmdB family regulatory protein